MPSRCTRNNYEELCDGDPPLGDAKATLSTREGESVRPGDDAVDNQVFFFQRVRDKIPSSPPPKKRCLRKPVGRRAATRTAGAEVPRSIQSKAGCLKPPLRFTSSSTSSLVSPYHQR